MSQGSTYPYCNITTDLQLAFKDIEDFAGWDTLTGFTPISEIVETMMSWLSGYQYRKSHVINPAAGAGTNYQIPIKVFRNYPEKTPWTKYANNPILSPEGDEDKTTWGYVVKSGATYHMYYSYNNISDKLQIGHATSVDGKAWTKDTINNPVLSTTEGCWCPFVWIEDGIWYMVLTVGQSGAVGGYVAISTSNDGITWSAPTKIIEATPGTWDYSGTESGGVIKVGSTYYVFYNTLWVTGTEERQSGIAITNDAPSTWTTASFTKDVNNPIFKGGRFCGSPFKRGSYYYFIVPHYKYGTDYAQIELYRDTSPTFYEGEREYLGPVISFGGLTEWDGRDLDVPSVLCDNINRDTYEDSGGELWCYYSGCVNLVQTTNTMTWYMGMTINADIDAALSPGSDSIDQVGLAGKCKGDFGDIRFTADDGISQLSYWIEENEAWNYAKCWVKIPGDLSTVSKTIYIYYGKEDAVSISNGNNTFDLFEDFNSESLDLEKWVRKGSDSETIIDGKLSLPLAGAAAEISAWFAICHGNGIWVAVAGSGTNRAMVSTDGISWVTYPIPSKYWQGICYAPALGLFVAVGDAGAIATSPDGQTWTLQTPANTNSLKSVCWSPTLGLLVAVGNSGTGNRVQTSVNGVDWIERASAADNEWMSVCWSPELNLFVAVASGGTTQKVMYSANGIDWTGTSNSNYAWQSVCWSPELSLFVAVVSNGGSSYTVATSSDGINWPMRGVTGSLATWKSVCWSADLELFIAVANGGSTYNMVMTSPDGIDWTLISVPMQKWQSVFAITGQVIAVSSDGDMNQILRSADGETWVIGKTPPLRVLIDSIYSDTFENKSICFHRIGYGGYSNYPMAIVRYSDRIDNKIYIHGDQNNKLRCRTKKDNMEIYSDRLYVRNYISGYHNFEIKKIATKVKFNQDEVQIYEITTNIPTVPMVVSMEQSPYGGTQEIDWVFVRKCIDSEPAHGIWGAEEEESSVPQTPEFMSTYFKSNTGYYGAVFEDGVALTAKTSISTVEATASTFWYDSDNDILYIHCSDGLDPDTHTITAGTEDWNDLKTLCRNDAMEEVESYLDIKYPRPLPFAKNSYNSVKYDSDLVRATAFVTVRKIIEHRDPNNQLIELFWKRVYSSEEPYGLLWEYREGKRTFSFEYTKDEFNGNVEIIMLDSTSTGKIHIAGKGIATDHWIYRVKIDTPGAVETATYKISDDDGRTWFSTLLQTYEQYSPLAAGLWIRFEGTFVLNDEWKIEIAGGPDKIANSKITSIRMEYEL